MRSLARYLLDRLPYVGDLRRSVAQQGLYPAGHYYSPIPAHDDVVAYLAEPRSNSESYPDIDMRKDEQFELLQLFQRFYEELPFSEEPGGPCRYFYNQTVFCYSDAILLYSFLRHVQPKRIIEVGSGLSSAVMLDTVERFLPQRAEIMCIEPFPDRLRTILRPNDHDSLKLVEKPVQQVPVDTFMALQPGDLLFIDSSHVIKPGNDLQYLLFQILPRLPVGVYVHFHDICYDFEYPAEWLLMGRYWNEAYVVRAFLSYNSDWEVYFFNNYAGTVFADVYAQQMPLCLENIGGSLYIRRHGQVREVAAP